MGFAADVHAAASGNPCRLLSSRPIKNTSRKSPAKSRHAWPSPAGGDSMKRVLKDFVKTLGISAAVLAAASMPAVAQKKYDSGDTDTEIKIGNIMPDSGPASAYVIIGKTM